MSNFWKRFVIALLSTAILVIIFLVSFFGPIVGFVYLISEKSVWWSVPAVAYFIVALALLSMMEDRR